MRILSATEAIGPAFTRTQLILFTPFRWGRTWKFCISGYLSIASSIFLPLPMMLLAMIPAMNHLPGANVSVALVSILAVVLTAIFLVIFYLCSRLRFAWFDVVLRREQFIAPAWGRHGAASWRWTIFKVVVGCIVGIFTAVPVAAAFRSMIDFAQAMPKPGQPIPPQLTAAIMSFYAGFFLLYAVFGLFFFLHSIVNDFVVPSLALESTTLREAFRRFGALLRAEPGQVALYALLKVGLAIAGYMAVMMAFYAVILVVMLLAAVIGIAGAFLLHLMHVPTAAMIALGVVFGALVYVGTIFYGMMLCYGTVATFLEAYLLYFLGGRYPLLGQILDETTPPPPPLPTPQVYGPPPGAWPAPPAV